MQKSVLMKMQQPAMTSFLYHYIAGQMNKNKKYFSFITEQILNFENSFFVLIIVPGFKNQFTNIFRTKLKQIKLRLLTLNLN
jgi:hypothetical protein